MLTIIFLGAAESLCLRTSTNPRPQAGLTLHQPSRSRFTWRQFPRTSQQFNTPSPRSHRARFEASPGLTASLPTTLPRSNA
jgi:hypothetical protein